jgi:tripartite ATP-independent transporter DctP family solute receptor
VAIKAGHDSSEEHPYQAALKAFADSVGRATDDRVTVEIFPNAQLGDEQGMVEGLKLGTVGMAVSSSAPLTGFSKKVGLLDLPFLASDLAQNYRLLDGEPGKAIAADLAGPTGGKVIAWLYAGQRNVWNSKRAITKPDDLKGLKIRTQQSPVQISTFNALGAQAVPMSFGELYQSLQTGVVDGADNDPVDVLTEKFYEVTKYYSFTGHRYIASAMLIASSIFDGMCAHDQEAVIAAGLEAQKVERTTQEGLVDGAVEKLKGFGIEFNDVPDKAPFQQLVQSVYDEFSGDIGADLIEAARRS